MRQLSLIHGKSTTNREFERSESERSYEASQHRMRPLGSFPIDSKVSWDNIQSSYKAGEFFQDLSAAAMSEFYSIAEIFSVSESTVLFREGQEQYDVLFLLVGTVRLSVNSTDGARLMLGIAGPGEVLGLTTAVLGCRYDVTAEARLICVVAAVEQKGFLEFLRHHPVANRNVARELSLDCRRTFGQLRTLGFDLNVPAKLARLFMSWCMESLHDGRSAKIHCSFTHEEIGERIGVSREIVTGTISDFMAAGLIEQSGTFLIVPDRKELAIYAGIDFNPPPRSGA